MISLIVFMRTEEYMNVKSFKVFDKEWSEFNDEFLGSCGLKEIPTPSGNMIIVVDDEKKFASFVLKYGE